MTDITELAPAMKAAAEKASGGDWVKESGDGWDAICSNDDQANSGFIIADFVGPDSASNREYMQLANPANIRALVEALEKAQGMESYWKTQCRGITDHCEQLQAQIAELESRTVTIEPFRSFVTDADLAALHRFAECCDDPESGGHDLEKEQVLRLEAIGALRRSGCVHWITGFGDVLISISAGIKVAE
ncbi:ead/Ea22-like family protein [Raoultella ornithinolytica]|uniref:ead/Ea22-like family protein n=1 Tax=Raoultella ornithinolytica TaxID=54291 RepID=UPI001F1F1D7E|nr:ead/Ea22-like family protein [Raoultella ornithinolytica]UIZ74553.1 ead/Ea22-like family protein [Raoultella ornithinolytica]